MAPQHCQRTLAARSRRHDPRRESNHATSGGTGNLPAEKAVHRLRCRGLSCMSCSSCMSRMSCSSCFPLFPRRKTQKNGITQNGRRIEKRAVDRYAFEKRSGIAFRANLSAGTEPERNVTRGAAAVRMTAARALAHAHPPPEKKARIPSRHAATGVSPQFPCPLTFLLRTRLRHHPDEKRFRL